MTDTDRIPTNLRTLLMLETLSKAGKAITATEFNQGLDLPKQTLHRLVTTLEREGYIIRDPGGKQFRPSRKLRGIATGLLNASFSHIVRHQILQRVAQATGETVNFVVPETDGMQYQDRVETNWAFRIQLPVGSSVPFHCTASGKVFLASLRKKDRMALVQSLNLDQFTQNTRTTPDALLREVDFCRKNGFATDDQEFMDGMVAIAVPVVDGDGQFVGALATHGPVQRMNLDQAKNRRHDLWTGAEQLQDALFG